MAITITNNLIRKCGSPPPAELGGGWAVTWLPGRVLAEGQAAAMEIAGAASQVPADRDPQVSGEGLWSRGLLAGPARPCRARRHPAGIRGARAG